MNGPGTTPPVEPGTSLGHYRLIEKLGEGGMGVVWKALDTTLDREVAIKLLPDALATDRERLARFEREAKVLATLNHPNIAAIYGFHQTGGRHYLAMELVPGEDLAQRLSRGAIEQGEALSIARDVAAAMEEAHEAGVVHRDLKPANVRLTPDGRVKVLDFGLAKALDGDPRTVDSSLSPTLTTPATRAGVILGTAAYMSPEQARGRPVDRRADIWAFGCLLFEMLAGRRTFTGETVSDTLAAILRAEPEGEALPSSTPPAVRALVARCLEKNPKRRLRDIGEARILLEDLAAGRTTGGIVPAEGAPAPAAAGRARAGFSPLRAVVWSLVSVALVAVAFTAGRNFRPEKSTPRVVKFEIPVDDAYKLKRSLNGPVFSPDGRRLVWESHDRLWVRSLDETGARELPGTDRARKPEWSPDGKWLAFSSGTRLMRISAEGGNPIPIATLPRELSFAGGICWLPDDTIVFTTGGSGLMRVSARGGEPKIWLQPGPDEEDFHNCGKLPGGSGVLTIVHAEDMGTIVSYDGRTRKTILHDAGQTIASPLYSAAGYILYVDQSDSPGIWAVPFSLEKMEVTGHPFLVAGGAGAPGVSPDGVFAAWVSGSGGRLQQILRVDRKGEVIEKIGSPRDYVPFLHLSPDGTKLAESENREGNSDVWIDDLSRKTRTRVTFETGRHEVAGWTGDGKQLLVNEGGTGIFLVDAGGAGETATSGKGLTAAASRDGRWMAFTETGRTTSYDIWYEDLREGGKPQIFLQTPALELWPQFSPDGKLLAYQSNESGITQVYIRPFPPGKGLWQVSPGEGFWPRWNAAGNAIYYIGDGSVWEVSVSTEGGGVRLGAPQALFKRESFGVNFILDWPGSFDVAPDEKSFIVLEPVAPANAGLQAITVVENWTAQASSRSRD